MTAQAPGPARLDTGRVLASAAAMVRERWPTLLALVLLGYAPRALLGLAIKDPFSSAHPVASAFGVHVAGAIGSALALHATTAALAAACLAPLTAVSPMDAFRRVLLASPALILTWAASECDTALELWNSWSPILNPPPDLMGRVFEPLGLVLLDFATAAATVALVGLFTPAVLNERLGLVDGLLRAWRLMAGARGQLAGLYVALSVAYIAATIVAAILDLWLQGGRVVPEPAWLAWTYRAVTSLFEASWGVLAATAYLEQRRLHEGALAEQIVETFG